MSKTFKIFRIITIILVSITLFFFACNILNYRVFPHFGFQFHSSFSGTSMLPLNTDGTLTLDLFPERAPFEELEVGDNIVFRKRSDKFIQSSTITFHVAKPGEESSVSVEKPSVPLRDEGISYSDEYVQHMVVRVVEASGDNDRAVYTRGINNPEDDYYPVMKSGYYAKIVWRNEFLGWPFALLEKYHGFVFLASFAFASLAATWCLWVSNRTKNKDKKDTLKTSEN